MRKTKIRFLINTLGGGGAEKVLVDLLKQMDKNQYDFSVVSVSGGVHASELPKHVQYKAIIHSTNRLSTIFAAIVYKMPERLFCRLFMKKEDYDIEVAYLEGFPTDVIAKMGTNAKKVAFVHCDVSVNGIMQRLYKKNEDCLKVYSKFDKVCFVSNGALKGFQKSVGNLKNSAVVHNVLDMPLILKRAYGPCEMQYTTNGLKIISVGRLSFAKKYDRLLQIASVLERKNYQFEIWIVGEGEERLSLEKIIKDNQITSVKLIGFQSNPYTLMRKADLFVCSSIYEGYSTAVTEATILGLPVLTTDCAGMDEILDNGKYGMIVENSEEALLNGLAKLLDDKELFCRLKNAAIKRGEILANQSAVKEYDKLFEEIAK